jgi:acetolactate synthase I/II/III large subunit
VETKVPGKNRVADYVVDRLIESGVDHFFILVGGNVMHLNDAIRESGVSYTAFHHEQSATMAAESYSRVTGKIACVVVTSGPGATNVVTGVAGAFYDSVPLIVICGNAKSSDLRTREMPCGVRQVGTFELPIHEICAPITKYSALITSSTHVVEILDSAISVCLEGRPGPSLINLPLDIQGEQMTNPRAPRKVDIPTTYIESVNHIDLGDLISELKSSLRPSVLIGHGVRVSGLSDQLLDLIKRINVPIFTTQLAKDFIPYDDDLFVGHVGVRGDRPGNIGIHNSDFILCIGTSLHQQNIGYEPQLFAPYSRKYILEMDRSVSGKRLPIEAKYINNSIVGFLSAFEAITVTYCNSNSSWLEELRALKEKYAVAKEPHDLSTLDINMYEFVDSLSANLEGDETVITDAGLCFYIMGQAFKLKKGQRYIVSGGLGSMGYALPASIGASLASKHPVIAVTGDGSMQMNVQELATLNLLGTKTKIFVINNGGYASLRNTQRSFFGADLIGSSENSGLTMPNWGLISAAYGIEYRSISESSALDRELKEIMESSKTQLIEVFCQHDQVVMPGVGNYKDEVGNLRSDALNEMKPKLSDDPIVNNLILN